MLVIFSSTASGDVMMFENIARQLLRLMGQTGNIPGGIAPENVPEALQRLQDALKEDPPPSNPGNDEDNDEKAPPVGMAVRAYPLIEMLKRAAKEEAGIKWVGK